MPFYAFSFMIFILASLGLPGTSGFVGEFLILLSIFSINTYFAIFATTGVVLAATYSLWLYRKIIFGSLIKDDLMDIVDLTRKEIIIFVPLVLLTLFIGIYPKPVLDIIEPSASQVVNNIQEKLK
jgi:NADH-quinone oxidoreductase subunit M